MTTSEQRVWSNYPVSPGSILKEEIEHRSISHRELATMMGCPKALVDDIIAERTTVIPEIADDIQKALGIKAHLWLNLEAGYRATLARNEQVAIEGPNHTCDLGDNCPTRQTYEEYEVAEDTEIPASILMDEGE